MKREHVNRKHIRNLNILRLTFTRLNLIAYTITKESLFSQTPWFIGIKKSVNIFFFILAAFFSTVRASVVKIFVNYRVQWSIEIRSFDFLNVSKHLIAIDVSFCLFCLWSIFVLTWLKVPPSLNKILTNSVVQRLAISTIN